MASKTNQSSSRQRLDINFEERLKRLKRKVSNIQNADVVMRELTRRMGVSKSFELLERELIEDAEIKRRGGE